MKQNTVEHTKANNININAEFERLKNMDFVQLKPYQVRFMENVMLTRGFEETNNNFCLLKKALFEKEIDTIGVSVGKKYKNCFTEHLHVHTDSPRIAIGNWNKTESTFSVSDNNYTNVVLCSINLACIENLEVSVSEFGDCDVYDIYFTYCGSCGMKLDYNITVKTKK